MKLQTLEEWIGHDHVLLHFNSQIEGVDVPEHLRGSPDVSIKLSDLFNFPPERDQDGVKAHLKFNGQYYQCAVPWGAVWGMTGSNGKSSVWPEDMPTELLAKVAKAKLKSIGSKLFGSNPPTTAPTEILQTPPPKVNSTATASPKPKAGKVTPFLKRVK